MTPHTERAEMWLKRQGLGGFARLRYVEPLASEFAAVEREALERAARMAEMRDCDKLADAIRDSLSPEPPR